MYERGSPSKVGNCASEYTSLDVIDTERYNFFTRNAATWFAAPQSRLPSSVHNDRLTSTAPHGAMDCEARRNTVWTITQSVAVAKTSAISCSGTPSRVQENFRAARIASTGRDGSPSHPGTAVGMYSLVVVRHRLGPERFAQRSITGELSSSFPNASHQGGSGHTGKLKGAYFDQPSRYGASTGTKNGAGTMFPHRLLLAVRQFSLCRSAAA